MERNVKESVAVVVHVLCFICMFIIAGNFPCDVPGSRFELLFFHSHGDDEIPGRRFGALNAEMLSSDV